VAWLLLLKPPRLLSAAAAPDIMRDVVSGMMVRLTGPLLPPPPLLAEVMLVR
jgi:hypothetical protein